MPRSAAASAAPDIVGLGAAGVSLTGLDAAWRASLALALGPLPPADGPAVLAVEVEAWRPPTGDPGIEVRADLDVRREGERLEVHDRRQAVRARVVGDRVLLSAARGGAGPTGRVLPFAIAPGLLDAGVALVHGATLADGERAVLVVGPTGAGKSTTAAAARSLGLAVLGDDIAAVDEDAAGWRVQGLARPVRVPADVAPGAPSVDDDVRGRVSPDGWATGGSARLVAIALVGHATEPTAARPAEPADAARAIVASAFATVRPASVAPTLHLAAALAALPCWRLPLDADPGTRLVSVGTGLRRILG